MVVGWRAVWLVEVVEGEGGGTSSSSSHPGSDTSPRRAHWEFKHRLSDVPLPLVNCKFFLQVLLFYGHGPGEWLCRAPQLANFSTRMAATGFEAGVCECMCVWNDSGRKGRKKERKKESKKERKKEGRRWVCGHVPSSLAAPFITLLSQLQTQPQCGASLLKSQHDKNSWIEVAHPTLPWHMGYFLLSLVCVVDRDCDRTLRLAQSLPKHKASCPMLPMIGCPSTQTVMSCCDTQEREEPRLALANSRLCPPTV